MPSPNRWLTLVVVSIALFLVVIDMTVLYTALPSLAQALHTTATDKLWILNAYSLVMAGLMPTMGALGDRFSHRRVFIFGMCVFALASAVAAFAPTANVLIAARALLAIGGAAMMPATIAIIRTTFQDPDELAQAIGIWAAIASGGAAIGPLLGGFLLRYFWWGSVFLINLPIILVAILCALRHVPVKKGNPDIPIDLYGCWQSVVALVSLAYGIKELAKPEPNMVLTIVSLVFGTIMMTYFVKRQCKMEHPLVDFRILSSTPIATGMLVALIASMTLIGFELVLSQRLQLVLGKTPLEAGIYVLPISLGSFFAGPIAGGLIGRFSCVSVIVTGLLLTALGIGCYILLPDNSLWQLLPLAVSGIGIGSGLTASSTLVMSNIDEDRAGMVGSVEGVAYEFGGGFGVTIFGSIMTAAYISQVMSKGIEKEAGSSLDEAYAYFHDHPNTMYVLINAIEAFEYSFLWVSVTVATMLALLSLTVVLIMGRTKQKNPK